MVSLESQPKDTKSHVTNVESELKTMAKEIQTQADLSDRAFSLGPLEQTVQNTLQQALRSSELRETFATFLDERSQARDTLHTIDQDQSIQPSSTMSGPVALMERTQQSPIRKSPRTIVSSGEGEHKT